MILKTKTGKEYLLTGEQFSKIDAELMKSSTGFIKIGEAVVNKSNIAEIAISSPDWASEASEIVNNQRKLNVPSAHEGSACQGEFSIHKRMIEVAKKQGKVHLLANNEWRKKVYDKLYEQTEEWCDVKKSKCFCSKVKTA